MSIGSQPWQYDIVFIRLHLCESLISLNSVYIRDIEKYVAIRPSIRQLSLLHIHERWKQRQIKATEMTEVVIINNFTIDHCMLSRV